MFGPISPNGGRQGMNPFRIDLDRLARHLAVLCSDRASAASPTEPAGHGAGTPVPTPTDTETLQRVVRCRAIDYN